MAQLKRIRAMIEQSWGWEGENRKEKSGHEEKGSKDSPRESQEEGTPLSISC